MVQEISDIGRFCPARSTCTFTGSRFYIQAQKKNNIKWPYDLFTYIYDTFSRVVIAAGLLYPNVVCVGCQHEGCTQCASCTYNEIYIQYTV